MIEAPGLRKCSKAARQVLKVPSRSMSITALKPLADIPVTCAGKLPAAAHTDKTLKRGYSEGDVKKIFGENFLCVIRQVTGN